MDDETKARLTAAELEREETILRDLLVDDLDMNEQAANARVAAWRAEAERRGVPVGADYAKHGFRWVQETSR
jgi:hypothetical protein